MLHFGIVKMSFPSALSLQFVLDFNNIVINFAIEINYLFDSANVW